MFDDFRRHIVEGSRTFPRKRGRQGPLGLMMSSESNDTARDYYNSTDADTFYHSVWGGEDIHVGIYNGGDEAMMDHDGNEAIMAMMAMRRSWP